jgi:pimeloyl-ACP methyl ester carboxylesterase
MPYATNALDGARIYYEDDGGDGVPVLIHGGLLDAVDLLRGSSLARSLPSGAFRRVLVDHRGLGRSEKPHDVQAYAMPTRVADAVAVLDEQPGAHESARRHRGRLSRERICRTMSSSAFQRVRSQDTRREGLR